MLHNQDKIRRAQQVRLLLLNQGCYRLPAYRHLQIPQRLLLFTTDGDLGQRLLHPSHHVWKTYRAIVDGRCLDGDLEPLRRGLTLDDGPCQPARCRVLEPADARIPGFPRLVTGTTAVEVIIREGRKNQVKRCLLYTSRCV